MSEKQYLFVYHMEFLEDNLIPSKTHLNFTFPHCDDVSESQFGDDCSFNRETNFFIPEWKNVTLSDLVSFNSFCPYCGRKVKQDVLTYYYIEASGKKCLGHAECIENQINQNIQFQYTKSKYAIEKGLIELEKKTPAVGGRQYVLSTKIEHSLNPYKYFVSEEKLKNEDDQIILHLDKDQEDTFKPNAVIIPLPQFNLKLNLREIGSNVELENITLNVDLSDIFVGIEVSLKQNFWIVSGVDSENWNPKIELQLIFDEDLKKKIINEMNFKYPHEISKDLPLIKVNRIVFSSKKFQTKLLTKSTIEDTEAYSSFFQDSKEVQRERDDQNPERSCEIPIKIHQPKLAGSARTYSITQTGSKEIQKKLRQMKDFEISSFIEEIAPYADELICNDYANYMIQTLVGLSTFPQRYRIFETIYEKIPSIVCSKQGTFALQQMIAYMNTHEEFTLISQIMTESFEKVAKDPNGNYFLRKLLPMMHFYYGEAISQQIFPNFIDLVNNKNSVCVLKVILQTIANSTEEEVGHYKKKLIDTLTLNTQKIIKDEFGNYFIQQAFEIFGEGQLKGISDFILNKLKTLSREKYSSSVICKCLNSYWKGTDIYANLKNKLNTGEIFELFRNREGNKVLFELASSPIDSAFKDKIMITIADDMPAKYNASKWKNSCRCRTGNVGTKYTSFTKVMNESPNRSGPMTKKKSYNIH